MADKPELLPLPARTSTDLPATRYRTGLFARSRSDMSELSIRELRAAVELDGRWGLINQFGKFILQPVHYAIRPFSCARAAFSDAPLKFSEFRYKLELPYYPGNPWIRRYTQQADPLRIRVDESQPTFYDHYDGGRWGFLNVAGETVVEPTLNNARNFSEDFAGVSLEDRYGFIDTTGKKVIATRFETVGDFKDGLALASFRRRFGFIDTAGHFAIPPLFERAWEFSDGLACVEIDNKYGYIDRSGSLRIQPCLDAASDFNEGTALVYADETFALLDTLGRTQFECWESRQKLTGVSEGLAVVSEHGPEFYANCEHGGNCLDAGCDDSSCKCKNAYAQCDKCYVRYGYFVDRFGTVTSEDGQLTKLNNLQHLAYAFTTPLVFEGVIYHPGRDRDSHTCAAFHSRFRSARPFQCGRAQVEIEEGKWRIVERGGEIIGDGPFDSIGTFKEEMAVVGLGERSGYVDRNGTLVIQPNFSSGRSFSCGLAAVSNGEKWGYIDKTGRMVIPCQFSDARDFQQVEP